MKTFQRILAVVLCLVMSLSVIGMTAAATSTVIFDDRTTGTLTIHKLEKGENADAETPSTGVAMETLPTGYTSMEGVQFTVYQVMTKTQFELYLANTLKKGEDVVTELKVSDFYDGTTVKNFDGDSVIGTAQTTDDDGKTTFTLDLGVYLVIESGYPSKVTQPMNPFLVSIPMTDPADENEWLYGVTVYPKNSTSEGNVILYKKNEEGSALKDVVFKLEKADSEPVTEATTWTDQNKNQTTDSTGKVEWESLAHGTYRITEVSAPAGYIVDQRPIVFTVTNDNKITCTDSRASGSLLTIEGTDTSTLTITLVNEKPDSKKEITEVNGKAVTGTDVKETNVSVGDVITYKVTVDVPANITDLKTFTVTDTPTNLKYNSISSVTCNGSAVAESAYAVSANGNGFKIEFTPSVMATYAGKQIVITYTATVLSSAADATAAHNTAKLTYSNKIKTDSTEEDGDDDKYDIEDGAVVYTYKLGVIKYKDAVGENNKLANVEFKLYTQDTGGNALSVVEEKVGTYRLATSTDTTTTTTLKTDANGKIVVKGLANGTYYLEETKTVDGYNLLKGRVAVELQISTITSWNISESYVNGVLTKKTYKSATHTSDDGDDATTDLLNTTIINKKGFDLPQTGGIGTLMFFIIGGVLIAGGICLITVPNKKRSV